MKLTPNRLAVLEELYMEGPLTRPKDRRAFRALEEAGFIEMNYLSLAEAMELGYQMEEGDREHEAEFVILSMGRMWRISQSGRKALEDYWETGIVIVNPLATMICQGTA